MSDKLSIVYVGNKAIKRDTITGSRLLFKKGEAIAVELAVARRLLAYPKVWVEEGEAKGAIENAAKAEAERLAAIEASAKAEAELAKLENMIALDDEKSPIDLAKYSGPQLKTLVEAHELTVDASKNPVAEYRIAVRDAMREKYGIPEAEDQE